MSKLRVGFLIDNLIPSQHVSDLISFTNEHESFDTPLLITGHCRVPPQSFRQKIIKNFRVNPGTFINRLFSSILFRVIRKIELRIVCKRFPKYGKRVDLSKFEHYDLINIQGNWSKSGLFLYFSQDDLLLIKQSKLDCIVRCGSGILKGDILTATKFGVISFHHGDNRVNRGGPSGFWEVLNREPNSGFVIQILTDELDGGEVLSRGNVMTASHWLANNAQLLEKSNVFMMRLLKDLSINRKLPKAEGVRLHGNPLYKIDSSFVLAKYLLTIVAPKIWKKLSGKLLSPLVTRWSVAYAYHNNFSKSLWRYHEIQNPIGRFLADPFVFSHDDCDYIFVEDLFYSDNKGRISAVRVKNDGYEFLGVVLEEEFHLSFPFVFKENNDIYMIPESAKNHDIRLYKSVGFPQRWELDSILMSDISAADTMIFKESGVWYLLTNICSAGFGDHQSELHIFYSDNLHSRSWEPIISDNPVIFDSLRARNGGIFSHNGNIYRVNQVHGHAHYGKSFCVNKILKISENEYLEEAVSEIKSNFKDDIVSTHHFSANETIAAVDFARLQRLKSTKHT
jgi:hypothetical protein